MISKIQPRHIEKLAIVYLRQSTMKQVIHHKESTERQYALKDRAIQMGWQSKDIRILDGDLGISGRSTTHREDFNGLIADVWNNKVGAIFALEVSRLARSNADWHRLLELCALTSTLIMDDDGCYDLSETNDQLLLGIKGTISQNELHIMRGRLHGGKINKAKRGELRIPLPAGLCYDDQAKIVLDPDTQVRGAMQLLFSTFRSTASAYAVVQYFKKHKLKFPKRKYGGVDAGKLRWEHLSYGRVLAVLRNPIYIGSYIYGRHQHKKALSSEGQIVSKKEKLPESSWKVHIKDHHQAYISEEEFHCHQEILLKNRPGRNTMGLSTTAREGLALLQGLLICGICGHRHTVRYTSNGGICPYYECLWRRKDGLSDKGCMFIRADILDNAVSKRALEVLKPAQMEIALKAVDELKKRTDAIDKQLSMSIQRAEYEAQLAERRYEEVDPSNRLVASTLESRWNDALSKLEEAHQNHTQYQQKKMLTSTEEQKGKLLTLAQDIPQLWNSPKTKAKDKKRMLRLLIKDITVEKCSEPKKFILHIRWQGGTCEDIAVTTPPKIYEQIKYSKEIIEDVRQLAATLSDDMIALEFNQKGRQTAKGRPFTPAVIAGIRRSHAIPSIQQRPHEFTVSQVMEKFGISRDVVYYWIERNLVETRRTKKGSIYWIKINAQKQKELIQKLKNSTKNPKLS